MAAVTKRPGKFVGLHFFVPANIMQLLEIVRGKETSAETMATAIALGKTLRKVGVVSANAFGFIGNRMLFDYAREAIGLAEEGVAPERIDRVMKAFGMAMVRSPCSIFRESTCSGTSGKAIPMRCAAARHRRSPVSREALRSEDRCRMYRYEKGSREPLPDPVTIELFREEAAKAGIVPRPDVSDAEIVRRLTGALIRRG